MIRSGGLAAAIVLLQATVWGQATPPPAAPQAAPQVGAPAEGGGPPTGMGSMGTGAGRRRTPRQNPCAADVQKFCAGTEAGQGRYRECLQQHVNELSTECKAHVEAHQGGRGGGRSRWQEACSAEVEKFCKDVEVGQGRVHQCLVSHQAELGTECQAAVQGGGRRRMP